MGPSFLVAHPPPTTTLLPPTLSLSFSFPLSNSNPTSTSTSFPFTTYLRIPSSAAGSGAGAQQPPRPPNAWILYRSDKLQQLPPPPEGQPKPTQAEVSKIISAQWRLESDEVRALYDQRAEIAKAEHARLYPNYRFAPMKKAEKDRIRQEKRQAKEQERAGRRGRTRVAPYPTPSTAADSPFRYVWTHPSPPDAFLDPQIHPVDSQWPSSRVFSYTRVPTVVPIVTTLPLVSPLVTFPSLPPPPGRWRPPESDSPTTFRSPLQEFPTTDVPHPTEVPLENSDNLFFSMSGLENISLQDMANASLLTELYGANHPGVFQIQGLANHCLTATPPGSIDLGVGAYPSGMCGSSSFDDTFRTLGENPATMYMSNPSPEEFLAAISMLAPPESQQQENISSPTDSMSIDQLQSSSFNFDEYLLDFTTSVPSELRDDDGFDAARARTKQQEGERESMSSGSDSGEL
ncbi:hypothetical protein B0F90DRAFT_1775681, partial [Multifurca ochricompacta]